MKIFHLPTPSTHVKYRGDINKVVEFLEQQGAKPFDVLKKDDVWYIKTIEGYVKLKYGYLITDSDDGRLFLQTNNHYKFVIEIDTSNVEESNE